MNPEPISFSNQDVRLAGTLYLPEGTPPYPCVIVLHGASMGLQTDSFYGHLPSRLNAQGIAVLLFDRRGSGESSGVFETADFETLAGDGAAGMDALAACGDIDLTRIFFYGISQGGWIAPIAAVMRPQAAGVIIVSGSGVTPARQMDYTAETALRGLGYPDAVIAQALALRAQVNEYFRGHTAYGPLRDALARVDAEPWLDPAYLYSSKALPVDVTQGKWYYEMDYDPLAIWAQVRQPTLFLVPGHDRFIPTAESLSAYRSATTHLADVTFAQIPGTDHVMIETAPGGTDRISETYIATLLDWLKRHT